MGVRLIGGGGGGEWEGRVATGSRKGVQNVTSLKDHRRCKLTLRVCYVNYLTSESVSRYKRPLTVETLYEK